MSCCNRTIFEKEKIRWLFVERLPKVNRSLPRMSDVIENWMDSGWPIYCEGDTVAFHAPVGNTSYFSKESPAEIIISGFCVAGEAGLKFVRSSLLSENNKKNHEMAHTFDTPTMVRGMTKIIEEYMIHKKFNLKDGMETFILAKNGKIPLMLTQALCPIVVDGSSKAADVWRVLKNSPTMRCFISGSLNRWWKLINICSNKDTKIMLMGDRLQGSGRAELTKLLNHSKLTGDNVEITGTDQKDHSLYTALEKEFNGRVRHIKHAAWYGRN